MREKTTKHELVQRLKRLHKEGFALSTHTLRKLDDNFRIMLVKRFGTVRRALYVAGVPYTTPDVVWRKSANKTWRNWKMAVRMIKELHAQGEPINWWSVRHRGDDYERMAYWASQQCSYGYSVLLKKAGFDPEKIRQTHSSRIVRGRDGKHRYGKKFVKKHITVRTHLANEVLRLRRLGNDPKRKRFESND